MDAPSATLHGILMEILGLGVLLEGASGVGKGELALELIGRGRRLVADDAPRFTRHAPGTLEGDCPELLRSFLHVRGLGVLNIQVLFGDEALASGTRLDLIVRLEPLAGNTASDSAPRYRTRRLLDTDIPELTLNIAPQRNTATALECIVRMHKLRLEGYHAGEDLSARLRHFMREV